MEDDRIGPQLLGRFDLTFAFEHAVLGIPLSALFVVAVVTRISTTLRRKSVAIRLRHEWLFWFKMVIRSTCCCLTQFR